MSDPKLPPDWSEYLEVWEKGDDCPCCHCRDKRRPYKSAIDGCLKGPEMPPFKGYTGGGPAAQQVIADLRVEVRELNLRLKEANDAVDRLKAMVRALKFGG